MNSFADLCFTTYLQFLHQAGPRHRVPPAELRRPRRGYVDYFVIGDQKKIAKIAKNFTFSLMPCQMLFQERIIKKNQRKNNFKLVKNILVIQSLSVSWCSGGLMEMKIQIYFQIR